MKPKIGIIGRGNVGSALERGLEQAGYEARATGRDAVKVRETAAFGDVIVLAVPFPSIDDALAKMGSDVDGKVLVDATNIASGDGGLAIDPTERSGAEHLQTKAPSARVVKAFNTVFAQHMDKGELKGERLTLFVAGNDGNARDTVRDLGKGIGFDPIDVGPLENARWMETLGYFNIQLGYVQKMGTDIAFKLVH